MQDSNLSRRSFLSRSLAVTATATAVSFPIRAEETKSAEESKPKILNQQDGMTYRQLPNSDIYFSTIALGGGQMDSAGSIFQYAIEKGINLIHTTLGYMEGRSIEVIGKTMKTHRDKVYLVFQDDFRKGTLEDALKKLNTDHVDFMMFGRHAPDKAKDPKIQEQFEKWKKEGKVRFAGLTTHDKVKETIAAGLETNLFSFILAAINQNSLTAVEEELKKAQEKKVGVMTMKTFMGIKEPDLQTAFLKKVLRNPAITTILKGFDSFEKFDLFAKTIKESLTSAEDKRLYKYANSNRSANCMLCGECTGVCPNGIAISTMMRCSDYYFDQCGDSQMARTAFLEVPAGRRSTDCRDCGTCEQVCPNGIAIRQRLQVCSSRLASLV